MTHSHTSSTANELTPEGLVFMCTVNNISLSSVDEGRMSDRLDNGVLNAYITADPEAKHRVISLKFFDSKEKENNQIEVSTASAEDSSQERANIILPSTAKVWSPDERILIFPKTEGGLWKVDCTHANEQAFTQLQDMLTYFINYENRHHMKNTLAVIDPVTCKVTKILAKDVHLDSTEMNTILDVDDFITAQETTNGQKLPVYVESLGTEKTISESSSPQKVKLLYKSGDALVTGSDWVAQAIVVAGNTLAKGISTGSSYIEKKIEPTKNPLKLRDPQRRALEIVHQTTCTANHVVKDVVDMTVSTALSAIKILVHNSDKTENDSSSGSNISKEPQKEATAADATRHFGLSAIQAALKIAGGVASAASAVATTTRESAIQMVHRKYGQDAGYLAEKTLGSGSKLIETIIYFDSRGICRSVVVSGVNQMSSNTRDNNRIEQQQQQQPVDANTEPEIVFDNEWPSTSTDTLSQNNTTITAKHSAD